MGDSAHEMLSHHTSRKKKWKHNIQDIFDDELYKNHINPKEYFHGTSAPARGMEIHLYLMVNTDGVSIFCSSNFSLWPVNFVITGLPPEKRCQIYIFLMLSIGQFITVGGLKVWLLLKIVTHNTLQEVNTCHLKSCGGFKWSPPSYLSIGESRLLYTNKVYLMKPAFT